MKPLSRQARKSRQWAGFTYLKNRIRFPFEAKRISTDVVSPLRKGESVEVIRMAAEDSCARDIFLLVRWRGRKMAAPLSQLIPIHPGESTAEAIGDWQYWIGRGYVL
jgi:hypothetical protein